MVSTHESEIENYRIFDGQSDLNNGKENLFEAFPFSAEISQMIWACVTVIVSAKDLTIVDQSLSTANCLALHPAAEAYLREPETCGCILTTLIQLCPQDETLNSALDSGRYQELLMLAQVIIEVFLSEVETYQVNVCEHFLRLTFSCFIVICWDRPVTSA
jgi:hypothetical protein